MKAAHLVSVGNFLQIKDEGKIVPDSERREFVERLVPLLGSVGRHPEVVRQEIGLGYRGVTTDAFFEDLENSSSYFLYC